MAMPLRTQPPAAETSAQAGWVAGVERDHWTLTQRVTCLTVLTEHLLWATCISRGLDQAPGQWGQRRYFHTSESVMTPEKNALGTRNPLRGEFFIEITEGPFFKANRVTLLAA